MKKAENTANPCRALVAPVLCGLAATLLLMMVGALAVNAGRMDSAVVPYAALASLSAGAFLCACLSARGAGRNRFLWGLAGGGALFLCLLIISLLWVGEPIRVMRIVQNGIAILAMSCLGGFAGASIRKKKHRKK